MKLKPCPFCSEPKHIELMCVFGFGIPYFVMCKKCEASGPVESSKAAAIKAWNSGRKAKK